MKAVIFDMDGLLVDTERLYVDAFKEACEIMGDTYNEDVFNSCIGTTKTTQNKILLEHFGPDYDFDRSNDLTHEALDRFIAEGRLELKIGVVEILENFKKNGFKMGVASSTANKKVHATLELKNIKHYFDEIVTGDMVTHGKPHPEIFLLAAKKLGVAPNETYVFEDSYNGVRASYDGGFYTIMVPDLLPPTDEMREKCDKIIENLTYFTQCT